MSEYILEIKDVTKAYPLGDGSSLTVLDHINYSLPRGRVIMMMGRSGSGKTTLLNMMSTLDDATSGDIIMYDKVIKQGQHTKQQNEDESLTASTEIKERVYSKMSQSEKDDLRRYRMGFVFQSVALIPVMTAYENVDFGLRTAGVKNVSERDERIKEVLEKVGLADRAKHYPAELSGGERQRIAIARAISHHPEILFADEPTGALDTATGIGVAELFRSLTEEEGITVIMTTHDPRMEEMADMLIRMGQ